MKYRIILSTIFLSLFLNFAFAQDDRLDEYSFEQEPIQTESATYFGVGGGYTFTFHFANFDMINAKATSFGLKEFDGQMLLSGGEGFTGVLFVKNLNVGFFSYGGKLDVTKDTLISSKNYKKALEYSTGFTGLNIDYGIVPFKSFAIKPGVGIGWGSLELETYQTENNFDWDGFKSQSDQNNFINRAESSFIFVKPNISFEYALTNYLLIRANASYAMTFGYDWKYNNTATLNNVPDDLNSNGMQIQIGVFVGLFNF